MNGVPDKADIDVRPIPPDLRRIRFLRPLRHYQPGDIALVPASRVAELVQRRIVELADPE